MDWRIRSICWRRYIIVDVGIAHVEFANIPFVGIVSKVISFVWLGIYDLQKKCQLVGK
jgi:hypothetical protein